ncbi:MAG: chemotaxis protein CheW [Acidimicrobiales bacterium]
MTKRLYASFALDGMWFGVDATDVQEVLRDQQLTSVPLAAPEVSGLMNLRGQIVVTLELRTRLGLSIRGPDESPVNIVLRTEHGLLAVVADEVGDVFEADDSELVPPPITLSGPAKDLVSAVHQRDDQLLLVLDVHKTAEPSAA